MRSNNKQNSELLNHKYVPCQFCNGEGKFYHGNENSVYVINCSKCEGNGYQLVPMTNGDHIRLMNNEQIVKLFRNLDSIAIYSAEPRRLMYYEYDDDFLEWLNKETDDLDRIVLGLNN